MISYDLLIDPEVNVRLEQAKNTFFWGKKGSFDSTFGPELGGLGSVLEPNIEFVRIAAAVYLADRSTLRSGSGSNWSQREIQVSVPVFNIARWEAVRDELVSLLNFLTGDSWALKFVKSPKLNEEKATFQTGAKRVVLLSGGADSAVGALMSRAELKNESHILVSHVGSKNMAPIQKSVVKAIEESIQGSQQIHIQINFRRHSESNGAKFKNEFSSRSRSLLFLAFGLAVASREKIQLWIPENGYASLSMPLGPERRGSLSTRTTHPYFLKTLVKILEKAGAHADLTNPFEELTKGEMFTKVASLLGKEKASELLSITHSCAHTGQKSFGVSATQQCGVCFGCVVRRASFNAANLTDHTKYVDGSKDPRIQAWLTQKSIARAVQDFANKGIRTKDVASMRLPVEFSASQAHELCKRGLVELKNFYA